MVKENEEVFNIMKFRHLFWLVDGLLYSKDEDGIRRLVVFQVLVSEFFRDVYDDKYHFGKKRIFKDLAGLYFRYKAYLVYLYVKHCYICSMNYIDNRLLLKTLQPIQTFFQSIYTISLDFVTTFFTVLSKGTL